MLLMITSSPIRGYYCKGMFHIAIWNFPHPLFHKRIHS
nr:MAG TPA: hypothetical protein [Caudoviricetes sp.]